MQITSQEFLAEINKFIVPTKTPFIIAIAGGSGSGKSYISKRIAEAYQALVISTDDYYIRTGNKNKDIPSELNLDLLRKNLEDLIAGKPTEKPIYTFGNKQDSKEIIHPNKVILVDGIFALNPKLADLEDLRIFVDSPEQVRLTRRLKRDSEERNYPRERTEQAWRETVQPMYLQWVLPQKSIADMIIDN